jgi:hypothetical protein
MRSKMAGRLIGTIIFSLLGTLVLPTASSAQQNLQNFICTPVEVATYNTYTLSLTYTGRVFVRCNGGQVFAVPLTDTAAAARFLSLFTAAFVAGKTIDIGYINGDTTGSAFNCTATNNCLPAIGATIH